MEYTQGRRQTILTARSPANLARAKHIDLSAFLVGNGARCARCMKRMNTCTSLIWWRSAAAGQALINLSRQTADCSSAARRNRRVNAEASCDSGQTYTHWRYPLNFARWEISWYVLALDSIPKVDMSMSMAAIGRTSMTSPPWQRQPTFRWQFILAGGWLCRRTTRLPILLWPLKPILYRLSWLIAQLQCSLIWFAPSWKMSADAVISLVSGRAVDMTLIRCT